MKRMARDGPVEFASLPVQKRRSFPLMSFCVTYFYFTWESHQPRYRTK